MLYINTPDVKTCPDLLALFKLIDEVVELGGKGEENHPCYWSCVVIICPNGVFGGAGVFMDNLSLSASVGSLDFVSACTAQPLHAFLMSWSFNALFLLRSEQNKCVLTDPR